MKEANRKADNLRPDYPEVMVTDMDPPRGGAFLDPWDESARQLRRNLMRGASTFSASPCFSGTVSEVVDEADAFIAHAQENYDTFIAVRNAVPRSASTIWLRTLRSRK